MPAHTHDGIDWVTRLADLQQADEANAPALRAVADRLVESLPAPQPTVLDVGCGAGGMSAALAEAMAGRAARAAGMPGTGGAGVPGGAPAARSAIGSGGTLVLVDAVPELLAAASTAAQAAVGVTGMVDVRTVRIDLADSSAENAAVILAHDTRDTSTPTPDSASALAENLPSDPAVVTGDVSGSAATSASVGDLGAGSAAATAAGLGSGSISASVRDLGAASADDVGSVPRSVSVRDFRGGTADDAGDASMSGLGGSGSVGGTGGALVSAAASALPAADLVWASNVAHHLPDQRRAVSMLVGWLAPGGCLALAEGGLSMRCLPWDVGIGAPGLQDRLIAAHGTWFHRMRTGMQGAVRLPVGWNQVLTDAGLSGVTAFTYLVDVPAPLTDVGRAAVVSWLAWMTRATSELLDPADIDTLTKLLDQDGPAYVGRRDDVFVLKASTVHLGWR